MEVEFGAYIAPDSTSILSDFIKDWKEKYAETGGLGEQTLEVYMDHIENHILPELGHMRLDQIKPIHVVNFLSSLKKVNCEEMAVSTKQYVYRVLRNIMERATEWKIIEENPVASVQKSQERDAVEKDANVYNEEEVENLLIAAMEDLPHWRVFISLAIAAGLRRGELLGLEWSHVDLEKGLIQINQIITRGKAGKPTIKRPKSRKSKRVISLPDSVIEELKQYRSNWKKEKIRTRDMWVEDEHEFLFCNENGSHFYPTTPTTWWRRFTTRANVRFIRLHDLRHTSATLLINQGVHAKIISERLGHSNIRITMDTYGHALQTADKEAAQKIDAIFAQKTAIK